MKSTGFYLTNDHDLGREIQVSLSMSLQGAQTHTHTIITLDPDCVWVINAKSPAQHLLRFNCIGFLPPFFLFWIFSWHIHMMQRQLRYRMHRHHNKKCRIPPPKLRSWLYFSWICKILILLGSWDEAKANLAKKNLMFLKNTQVILRKKITGCGVCCRGSRVAC